MSSACPVVTSSLPTSVPPSARQWTRILGVTGLLAAVGALTMGPLWSQHPGVAICCLTFTALFACAGVILWEEPVQRRTGWLLIVTAALWPMGWSEEWALGPLPLLSGPASYTALSLAAWGMLRYPDPAMTTRAERVFLGVLTVVLIGGAVAQIVTARPEWKGHDPTTPWLTLYADRTLNQTLVTAQRVLQLLLAGGFAAVCALRVRRLHGLDRQLLAPTGVAASAAVLAAATVPLTRLFDIHGSLRDRAFALQAGMIAAVPVAFGIGVIRRRLAGAAVLTMIHQVQRRPTPEAVQTALRSALRDESLQVYFWAPDLNAYVDLFGVPVRAVANDGRLVLPVRSAAGDALALIDVDAALARHQQVLAHAVAAGGLALENAQLQAAVLGRLDRVRAVRRRAVQAGVSERRRVERDLHDGAQQRLLALRLVLAAADGASLPEPSRDYLQELNREIGRALEELREVARGIHPALLSQVGLAAAVEAYAQRLPAEIDVDLPADRFPAEAEETAYTLIVSVLENLGEAAGPVSAQVRGHRAERLLTIEIQTSTDGVHPFHLRLGAEAPGLLDQVRALGGDVMVSALPPTGSLLVAAVPYGPTRPGGG